VSEESAESRLYHIGLKVLTPVVTKISVFWDIPPCSALKVNRLCLSYAFTLVSCWAYSSAIKIEVTCSSETSADFQRTTWRYIPEDRTLQVVSCL
jgi:hypothetical protein